MATETPTRTRPPQKSKPEAAATKPRKLPPFHVILHDDDVHDMAEVVESLARVTPVGQRQAVKIMLAAHLKGRAIVMTAHKERAEFYRDRLRSQSLIATIEPA